MAKSFYSHIKDAWKDPDDGKLGELQWQRKQEWRDQGAIERIDRPTRLDKARTRLQGETGHHRDPGLGPQRDRPETAT